MLPLSLFIPGEAVAKGRPRFTRARGNVRSFTPAKTARYEQLIALAASDAMAGAVPADGPVTVSVVAHLAIPKSLSKRKRADAIAGLLRPCTRPDVDNYLKIALDGLNKVAWGDDSQVVRATVSKRYAETPGMTIEVRDAAA
jgi:Holliday junction resolvase RusA-like endonuclease